MKVVAVILMVVVWLALRPVSEPRDAQVLISGPSYLVGQAR